MGQYLLQIDAAVEADVAVGRQALRLHLTGAGLGGVEDRNAHLRQLWQQPEHGTAGMVENEGIRREAAGELIYRLLIGPDQLPIGAGGHEGPGLHG